MTHDPRDRVEVLTGGAHRAWARKAASILAWSHDARPTVRGTREALAAAGVDTSHLDDAGGLGRCVRVGEQGPEDEAIVDVVISPVSLAPRPSGKSASTAPRRRPKRALTLSPDAWARLSAAAERTGLSLSAYVERLASELPPAVVG